MRISDLEKSIQSISGAGTQFKVFVSVNKKPRLPRKLKKKLTSEKRNELMRHKILKDKILNAEKAIRRSIEKRK